MPKYPEDSECDEIEDDETCPEDDEIEDDETCPECDEIEDDEKCLECDGSGTILIYTDDEQPISTDRRPGANQKIGVGIAEKICPVCHGTGWNQGFEY